MAIRNEGRLGSVQLYALATLRRRGLDQCGVTRLDLLLRRWAEWG